MTGKLALPTFVMGPEDKVAAVDVYTETKDTVVNSIQDTAPAEGTGLLQSVLRGGKSMLGELPAALKMGQSLAQSLSSGSIVQRIAGVSNVAAGLMNKLSPDITKTVMGMVGSVSGPISMAVGAAQRLIPGQNLGNISALSNAMNQITGTNVSSIVDKGGLVATMSGLVNTAAGYGIPNSFSALTGNGSLASKLSIASNVLPGITKMGDIISTSDIAKSLPFGSVSNNPSFSMSALASNYSSPFQCTASDYSTEYTSMKMSFDSISTNWDTALRTDLTTGTSTSIPSITTMLSASSDLKAVVDIGAKVSDNPLDKLQLLAAPISKLANSSAVTDVYSGLSKYFPNTNISTATPVNMSVVQDPVVANMVQTIPDPQETYREQSIINMKSSQMDYLQSQASSIQSDITALNGVMIQSGLNFQKTMSTITDPAQRQATQASYDKWVAEATDKRNALETEYDNVSAAYEKASDEFFSTI